MNGVFSFMTEAYLGWGLQISVDVRLSRRKKFFPCSSVMQIDYYNQCPKMNPYDRHYFLCVHTTIFERIDQAIVFRYK